MLSPRGDDGWEDYYSQAQVLKAVRHAWMTQYDNGEGEEEEGELNFTDPEDDAMPYEGCPRVTVVLYREMDQ